MNVPGHCPFPEGLDEHQQAALQGAIERGIAQARAGLGRPAEDVLAEMRRRR